MNRCLRGFSQLPFVAIGALLLLTTGPLRAEAPPVSDGAFISITYPLTDKEIGRIKELTGLARQDFRNRVKEAGHDVPPAPLKIVYDFNPDGQPSGPAPYGLCRELAAFLLGLNDVTTIAFVHADVTRHAVLPVLACREIVMSRESRLGDAVRDQAEPVGKDQLVFYREVAEARGRPAAIVLKMLDRDLEVWEATRNNAVWYVAGDAPPEDGVIVNKAIGPVLPRDKTALLTTTEAQRFGLCRRSLQTREEVAGWYGIPSSRLRDDPLLGRAASAWFIEVRGALTRSLEETVKRRLSRAVAQRANFIVLQLECGGGDPDVAGSLGEYLRGLKDTSGQHGVMTVAYVTEHARDNAVFLALGCTQIVMHPNAHLGDYDAFLKEKPNYQAPVAAMLEDLAKKKHYPALLVRGLADPALVLYRVKNQDNPLERGVISEEQLRAAPDRWLVEDDKPLKVKDQLLTLNAAQAKQLGLAQHVVENLDQLRGQYKLDAVQQAGPDWLDRFAQFLRSPVVSSLLVLVGLACGLLELKLPGFGLAGVLSALSFVLFFWAHAQLAFSWLALLLFVLGIVFIALEIFVVPGTAVLGVSGVFLLLTGLGLATLERWPQTESEWYGAATNVGRFGVSLIGALIAAVIVGRYLPNIPYANRMILVPPAERAEAEDELPEATAKLTALLGAIGVTATPLRPSGMVRFGEEYVDVVAEGGYVDPGARVQVVEIEANRVVVKEV
ncbi:MAG: hypothetical protein JNM56_18450 [Planctomycetia bacterium]|nr:hypothetical protein [Planctomycetia bacterium]